MKSENTSPYLFASLTLTLYKAKYGFFSKSTSPKLSIGVPTPSKPVSAMVDKSLRKSCSPHPL
jgi:hypothetical protein